MRFDHDSISIKVRLRVHGKGVKSALSVRVKMLAVAVLCAAVFTGCSQRGETYVAARWVKADTTLVYLTRWWIHEGGLLPAGGGLKLYHLELKGGGYRRSNLLTEVGGDPHFCDQMAYTPQDSLIAFSYAATGACQTSRRVRAGKIDPDVGFVQSDPVDTAALLVRLQEEGAPFDSGISVQDELHYSKLCFAGRGCITP
jgi:hypothetical protein